MTDCRDFGMDGFLSPSVHMGIKQQTPIKLPIFLTPIPCEGMEGTRKVAG